ncbi:hypothetical protein BGZ99_002081 [Dissophora globulifera]|uniref:RlpA-like protein double-psi beta-barrel domain-containing protein n=1 Tax=Dissophora globulifera TaxID=979702 RepID=A0A9P6RS95_9FUNG|nr:hypothetical protein BGZ99_002081 [Dissophora globulifera]
MYTGFATLYNGHPFPGVCTNLEYSVDEVWVTVNAAQFDNDDNILSFCGQYVTVKSADAPSKSHTYKIVDLCKNCEEGSLELSEQALRAFTDSDRTAIEWELLQDNKVEASKPLTAKQASKNSDTTKDDSGHTVTKYHGRGTWFSDTMGSCGKRFSQNEMIVALNEAQMGKMWGKGSKCGAKIRVSAKGSSASVVVRVVDTCPHQYCSFGQLDLSRAAFKKFASLSKGILDLEWSFI